MAEKAKHAYGSRANLDSAIASGKVDSFDVLFLSGENEAPAMGWVSKDGEPIIIESVDSSALEAKIATKANAEDVTQLESEVATKANAEEVNTKIGKIETALGDVANASYTHEKIRYEITDVPVGTLIDYGDREIRVMCPKDCVFTKQAVGVGGDANSYYMTFKTYVHNDNVVGYIEHLSNQVDREILTTFSTDKYGRRYQSTWLALAKYDEATDSWTYYGANSTTSKFIGWDYQIDWYDANGVMIASDCLRINLSNEECHSSIKPYYGISTTEEIETKVEEVVETKVEEVVEEKVTTKVEEAVATSNAYTDAKIAEIAEAASYEVVEF